jgi:hypothetical protein
MNINKLSSLFLKLSQKLSKEERKNLLFEEQEKRNILEKQLTIDDRESLNYFGKFSDVYKILISHNIYPIQNSFVSALLGKGSSSDVFEVDYKGKRAAAKITNSINDFEIILKLNNLRPEFGNLAKHLPIVYDYFQEKLNGRTIYIVIVEYLNKTNYKMSEIINYLPTKHINKKDYKRYKEIAKNNGFESLLKCLIKLKDEYKIYWYDMRSVNIMERPSTRDLVISDPGNFIMR